MTELQESLAAMFAEMRTMASVENLDHYDAETADFVAFAGRHPELVDDRAGEVWARIQRMGAAGVDLRHTPYLLQREPGEDLEAWLRRCYHGSGYADGEGRRCAG